MRKRHEMIQRKISIWKFFFCWFVLLIKFSVIQRLIMWSVGYSMTMGSPFLPFSSSQPLNTSTRRWGYKGQKTEICSNITCATCCHIKTLGGGRGTKTRKKDFLCVPHIAECPQIFIFFISKRTPRTALVNTEHVITSDFFVSPTMFTELAGSSLAPGAGI